MAVISQFLPNNTAEQYFMDIKTWGQANDIGIKVAQELGGGRFASHFTKLGWNHVDWVRCFSRLSREWQALHRRAPDQQDGPRA
jgi:hypothetical protein